MPFIDISSQSQLCFTGKFFNILSSGPSREYMEGGSWRCEIVGQTDANECGSQIVQAVLHVSG